MKKEIRNIGIASMDMQKKHQKNIEGDSKLKCARCLPGERYIIYQDIVVIYGKGGCDNCLELQRGQDILRKIREKTYIKRVSEC